MHGQMLGRKMTFARNTTSSQRKRLCCLKPGGATFHDKEADEIRTRMVDVDRCLPAESGLEKNVNRTARERMY
jgi:hypothetical protein